MCEIWLQCYSAGDVVLNYWFCVILAIWSPKYSGFKSWNLAFTTKQGSQADCLAQIGFAAFVKGRQLISGLPFTETEQLYQSIGMDVKQSNLRVAFLKKSSPGCLIHSAGLYGNRQLTTRPSKACYTFRHKTLQSYYFQTLLTRLSGSTWLWVADTFIDEKGEFNLSVFKFCTIAWSVHRWIVHIW